VDVLGDEDDSLSLEELRERDFRWGRLDEERMDVFLDEFLESGIAETRGRGYAFVPHLEVRARFGEVRIEERIDPSGDWHGPERHAQQVALHGLRDAVLHLAPHVVARVPPVGLDDFWNRIVGDCGRPLEDPLGENWGR